MMRRSIFTDQAWAVWLAARNHARRLGHPRVTVHHMAAAVVGSGGVAAQSLEILGRRDEVGTAAMRAAEEEIGEERRPFLAGVVSSVPDPDILPDPRLEAMLDHLVSVACVARVPVGTAELLAGLVREKLPYLDGLGAALCAALDEPELAAKATTFEDELRGLLRRRAPKTVAEAVAMGDLLVDLGITTMKSAYGLVKPDAIAVAGTTPAPARHLNLTYTQPDSPDRAAQDACLASIPHDFKTGEQVRISIPAGHTPKYNRDEILYRVKTYPYAVGTVVENPNPDVPDAVQVSFPPVDGGCGGEGAIEACCLVRVG